MRAEKIEPKHIKDESEVMAGSSGKEDKASVRRRGEKASDSPRPKKQVRGSSLGERVASVASII